MVGAVFSKLRLIGRFGLIFRVGAKGEMLDDVGDFKNLGLFSVAKPPAELDAGGHDAGAGDVDE